MHSIKPWYLSRTVWASIATVILGSAGFFGVETTDVEGEALAEAALQLATAIAGVIALMGRLRATSRLS